MLLGQTNGVAEVVHESSGLPPKKPLNLDFIVAALKEENTGTHSKGMGAPSAQLVMVLLGIELVDLGSNGTHGIHDLLGMNQVDLTIARGGKHRQRSLGVVPATKTDGRTDA